MEQNAKLAVAESTGRSDRLRVAPLFSDDMSAGLRHDEEEPKGDVADNGIPVEQ